MPVKRGFEVRFLLIIALICAPAIWASSPSSLEVEDESVLDVIAGKIERPIPEYWEAKLDDVLNAGLSPLETDLQAAEIENQLNRQDNALDRISKRLSDSTTPEDANPGLYRLRAEVALNLWWMGGKGNYTPDVCLMIALDSAGMQSDAKYLKQVTTWARDAKMEEEDELLPDILGLAADADSLNASDLAGAEGALIRFIRHHGAWENFDVMYALSSLYQAQGKPNLAHFARLRAWELHESGNRSMVRGAEQITDIKAVTSPPGILDADSQTLVRAQYTSRRTYARKWNEARAAYAAAELRKGPPGDSVTFWASFQAPPSDVSKDGGKKPESEDKVQPGSNGAKVKRTWITLGILFVLLILGGITKARISRSATKLVENTTQSEGED